MDNNFYLMIFRTNEKDVLRVEGFLSFIKGCSRMALRTRTIKKRRLSFLNQGTKTPAVYTKLSCFLPWIAEQYNMEFAEDYSLDCSQGTGNISDFNADDCRSAVIEELPCIFPFYWNEKLYDHCVFLEEEEFLFPVFRCPVRNITRKIDGINSFYYKDIVQQVFSLHCIGIKLLFTFFIVAKCWILCGIW